MWLLFSLPLLALNQLYRHNHRRMAILGQGGGGERKENTRTPFLLGHSCDLEVFSPTKKKPDSLLIHNTVHVNNNVPWAMLLYKPGPG